MPKRTHDGIKKRCTCGKRQWPKCSHPWWFGFHFNGKEHRHSLDKVALARGEKVPVGKGDAMVWRDRLRNEIRAGAFAPVAPAADTRLTFDDLCARYLTTYVGKIEKPGQKDTWTGRYLRPRTAKQADYHLSILQRTQVPAAQGTMTALGAKPIEAITKADVEAVREARRPRGVVGCNRLMARLRHPFNWAITDGFLEHSPFKRGPVTVVKLEHRAETARTRRLEPATRDQDGTERDSEEARLLKHASPHLHALIVAALSTGCRLGEFLTLQRSQIRLDEHGRRWIMLSADKTKTAEARVVPIGADLGAVLEMRRLGPDGKEHAVDTYVFGNEVGEPIASIRTAWEGTCKRAGIDPRGLHFHDLRREFACRLLESSADLHDVRDFLGHANITTTSRYLRSRPSRLARALDRMEGTVTPPGDGFAHHSHKASAPAEEQPEQHHGKTIN